MDQVTDMVLETSCGTPISATTQISPNIFSLCSDNIACLTFTTTDDGNLSIADGTVTTNNICETVKNIPAIQAISNKRYKLSGESVVK
jgi:hypothetical protein